MTVLRCPVCRSISKDPPLRFACPECGLPLAWTPRDSAALPVQLGLFGDDVPVAPAGRGGARHALIAAVDVGRDVLAPQEGVEVCDDAPEDAWPTRRQTHQDALAVITELFHAADWSQPAADDRAGELLAARSARELHEVVLAAGWMAAAHLRFIESTWPGMATQMLERLGLIIAGMPD